MRTRVPCQFCRHVPRFTAENGRRTYIQGFELWVNGTALDNRPSALIGFDSEGKSLRHPIKRSHGINPRRCGSLRFCCALCGIRGQGQVVGKNIPPRHEGRIRQRLTAIRHWAVCFFTRSFHFLVNSKLARTSPFSGIWLVPFKLDWLRMACHLLRRGQGVPPWSTLAQFKTGAA